MPTNSTTNSKKIPTIKSIGQTIMQVQVCRGPENSKQVERAGHQVNEIQAVSIIANRGHFQKDEAR